MKTNLLLLIVFLSVKGFSQVHTSYLWHMHQPTYWGETSKSDPNRYQLVKESEDLKNSGQSNYSDGLAHPLNNLNEIFNLNDRINAYQYQPKNAVSSISGYPKAGAQMTYGGSLIENINSLGDANQWGYSSGWKNDVKTAHSWQTSGGKPRLDVMGFTMHHTLSPLVSDEVLKKEIQAHKYYATQNFGFYSNGYWPAEASFSERIIKVLIDEGFKWTVVANSHLARTLADYPLVFGTNGCNIDPPNKADKVTTNGTNWHNGQIDGRGGQFAAPYCFTPHKAKYVDPNTGTEYKITVVPMADLDSYRDGFSQQGVDNISSNIAPYAGTRPPLVLLAHDGDNAWGGGSSYYGEAVPGFSNSANGAGYVPTTIEQYLADFPVPDNDVVKVEDGSWFNAANDWGSPQFINWLWPLNLSTDKSKFNPDGWTEDVRNMAVLYAGENFCIHAEALEGGVDIAEVVKPVNTSTNAERAWHFLLPGYDSGNAYYGLALDLEIKATLAANRAIAHAIKTINANSGVDNTKPSVLTPQRYPYNPGEIGFGANYGYKQILNSADFAVWTLAFDVSGIQSAVLKYRVDVDGVNSIGSNQNETYAGGAEVGFWVNLSMTERIFPKDNITNNPEVSFFMLPDYIANQYHAEINGISEKMLDYYVEITDKKGNVTKSKIQQVWVGKNLNVSPVLSFTPESNYSSTAIDVTISATDSNDPNPTIYYTNDGTTPTTSSQSAVKTVSFSVSETTTIKAFAKDADGNLSDIQTKTYYIGDVPTFTVHFKKPAAWSNVPRIHYWDALPTGTLTPTTWPGVAMTEECDGWWKFTFTGISSTKLIFNNAGSPQTADLTANTDAWYDGVTSAWVTGVSTGPCLQISPAGGSFITGETVNVTLTASDGSDANPKIYYTIDGSVPSTSSPYFTKTGTLNFTTSKTLRAFAKNASGSSSDIKIETYTFVSSGLTAYFKPPTSWTSAPKIFYWNVVGGSTASTSWPGVTMNSAGDGWYKFVFAGATSVNAIFNNGSSGVGTNQTEDLIGQISTFWYEWGVGLGNKEIKLDENLVLFPNPTNDKLNIVFDKKIKKYAIYNSAGMFVKQEYCIENSINVKDFSQGIYFLKLQTEDNLILFKKFLVE